MAWKWYVQVDESIAGPFSTDEVRGRLNAGQFHSSQLIWAPGFEGWQNLKVWVDELPNLSSNGSGDPGPQAWHYAFNGQSRGPLSRDGLIGELKNLESVGEVMVWTKGMKEWAPLFEFHDLLTELGVNKRQFPRADLSGKTVIKVGDNTMIAPLVSISEGGFGITLSTGLVAGQNVNVELQSPSFRETLHAKADVRYVSGDVVGLKFSHISQEHKGAIIQFIKQTQMRFTLKAA